MFKKYFLLGLVLALFFISGTKEKKDTKIVNEVTSSYSDTYNQKKCKNILIIDKINLKKCMNYNDVSKDIAVIYEDKTVVLAGHSGTGPLAFFKDLYKLEVNDEVIFYHQGIKNRYVVNNISYKDKKENLHFKNIDNQLILVTCSYKYKDKQLVYFLNKNDKID